MTVYDIVVPGNKLVYNDSFQTECFQKLLQSICEGVTELFNAFFMLFTDLLTKPAYRQYHNVLQELHEKIREQQEALWTQMRSIMQPSELPRLNDFVRTVYIAATDWNESMKNIVSECVQQSKTSIIPKIFTTPATESNDSPRHVINKAIRPISAPPRPKYVSEWITVELIENTSNSANPITVLLEYDDPVETQATTLTIPIAHSVQKVARLSPDVPMEPDFSPVATANNEAVFNVTPKSPSSSSAVNIPPVIQTDSIASKRSSTNTPVANTPPSSSKNSNIVNQVKIPPYVIFLVLLTCIIDRLMVLRLICTCQLVSMMQMLSFMMTSLLLSLRTH